MPRQTIALLNQRLTHLEKNSEKIDGKLDSIMENHLPHINNELVSMKTRIGVLTAVNLGAIILAVLINKAL